MKQIILITTLLTISFYTKAQNESVRFFDLKFKAKEVNGQKMFAGVADRYFSKILNPLIEKNESEYLQNVGTVRKNTSSAEVSNLIDLSSQARYFKVLDEINFEFYESKGFDKLIEKEPELLENKRFQEFKMKISQEENIGSKKEILFNDDYREIRKKLIDSRLEIVSKSFQLSKKKVSKFTFDLKVKVDSVLEENSLANNGKLRAYLASIADESTEITGIYHTISLDNEYVGIFIDHIDDHINFIKGTANERGSEWRFVKRMAEYLENENYVITSSMVALQLQGSIDKTKINVNDIAIHLNTQLQIPLQIANQVASSVNVTFERHEVQSFKNEFQNVLIIRYFSSDKFRELRGE